MTPTQRSLDHMRKQGWLCQIVEQTIRGKGIVFKRDLWGIGDILCLRQGEILLVQTTSATNLSSRVKKIAECEHLPEIRRANIGIVAHGWRKSKGRWVVNEVDCS